MSWSTQVAILTTRQGVQQLTIKALGETKKGHSTVIFVAENGKEITAVVTDEFQQRFIENLAKSMNFTDNISPIDLLTKAINEKSKIKGYVYSTEFGYNVDLYESDAYKNALLEA